MADAKIIILCVLCVFAVKSKFVTNRFQGLLAIHLAALLFGAAGLFGKFLDLPAALIVYGRALFASLVGKLVYDLTNYCASNNDYPNCDVEQ